MTPIFVLQNSIDPAFKLLGSITNITSDDRARVLALTIMGQESGWTDRRQIGEYEPGIYQEEGARGLAQFERLGAVTQLINRSDIAALCAALDVPRNVDDVYEAIAWNDWLAAGMARILLWQDPAALPAVGDVSTGWNYYLRNWEPGAPRPADWPGFYSQALAAINATPLT